MTPAEFIQWAAAIIFSALFVLPIIAGGIYGAVVGVGSVIEWFDKRRDARRG